MILLKLLKKIKSKVKNTISSSTSQHTVEDICDQLTVLPGIGAKNSMVFYEAGFKTPQAIIDAKDEDLLAIPGVGINFVKRLRKARSSK
tara:strand:+ start:103 stop:369 length:267 start_codon:yes stop_codon:yes gene_type:complete